MDADIIFRSNTLTSAQINAEYMPVDLGLSPQVLIPILLNKYRFHSDFSIMVLRNPYTLSQKLSLVTA